MPTLVCDSVADLRERLVLLDSVKFLCTGDPHVPLLTSAVKTLLRWCAAVPEYGALLENIKGGARAVELAARFATVPIPTGMRTRFARTSSQAGLLRRGVAWLR